MRTILPGKPQAELQAVTTGLWQDKQIIAYISGSALVILDGPNHILQTIYVEQDGDLAAVDFDEGSGKIAICSAHKVYIYKPYGHEEGALKWSLQFDWTVGDGNDAIRTLSWGSDEELLVGGSSLNIYSTNSSAEQLWESQLSSPAKFASFSHDASLVASTGAYDRLVKVWKRIILSSTDQRFDHGYLPHPAPITQMHWRRARHREQHMDNVLYTVCADKKLRVWAPMDPHGLQVLQQWAEIDLMESIQPRSIALADRSPRRFAFVIDSREFSLATERAVQQASDAEAEQHGLAHLIEIANRNPEVCVVLDDRGNMSAWGLERVGCKDRQTSDIFNVAHVEGLHLHLPSEFSKNQDYIRFYNFSGNSFTLLAHHFDGRLEWFECRLDQLFDPSRKGNRLTQRTTWTGHSSEIKKAVRTATGKALISRTVDNESIVWKQKRTESGVILTRHSTLSTQEHIHRSWVLHEGNFVILLHHESISIWSTWTARAVEIARRPYSLPGKALCLIRIPETQAESGVVYVATITSEFKGVGWEIHLPSRNDKDSTQATILDFGKFELGSGDDLSFVLPVDPAGTAPVISGFLDVFARDIAISYTHSGVLESWTARVNVQERKLEWLNTSTVHTGVENPSLASGTSIRKAAVVDADKTSLTIWSTRSGQLEHQESFEGQGAIQDIDWSSTPDNQSILAVGFPYRVVIFTQMRFDYINAGPSWAAIREINIRDLTPHPIGDSVWLGSGNLVIGAGNQLFVQDDKIQVSDGLLPDFRATSKAKQELDLFTVVSRLNGPLPVYHPQFLAQCILSGKMALVQRLLITFYKKLKFFTEGDEMDELLGLDPEHLPSEEDMGGSARKEMHSSYVDFEDDEDPETVTEEVASSLTELLTKHQVPQLSSREQFNLVDIVECVGTVEKHRRSIDDNGCRFLLFFRQHVLRAGHSATQVPIAWREITWAYHSGSQDILVDLVSRHFQGRMLWHHARESGMFMWMTDLTALRTQFENIARNEYTKTDEKNPVDCSLYYMALKKKAVLVGLWRMATWNREQSTTQRFLSNNFNEARWRTAAMKNAYALMGKHRFAYAAAFFLLGDNLKDAVSVLSNQMGDTQLAIAVARVYEGDDGPVLREFLEEKVLPQAVMEGNRWLATWAFWMLNKRDRAVRSLVSPLSNLMSPAETPNLQSKLFLTDDPALIVLYKQLRAKSLQTLRGALAVSPKAEWEFILHTARLYVRMGCDTLALDLVKTWEFLNPPAPPQPTPLSPLPTKFPSHSMHSPTLNSHHPSALDGFDFDPRQILRRRSSLVVADLPTRATIRSALQEGQENGTSKENENAESEKKTEPLQEKKKPPPTQFQEPDASSLLDSFGF
ncbi:hypothetical protein NA57DRAFT_67310 [Rhizodiscina lignyota]|uniref:RAVE complex protein Rav1 C-terminal domain-containing protein n=1 Tax=Rhizodiscina lignyota TaxID=1504668 RepID=A0A9P4IC33_9PEZI|nr:hypothetical protein NA57DRAFT_67310 [Rhizodiscina lignyota]